jgi:flagellar assembly factor FliW
LSESKEDDEKHHSKSTNIFGRLKFKNKMKTWKRRQANKSILVAFLVVFPKIFDLRYRIGINYKMKTLINKQSNDEKRRTIL